MKYIYSLILSLFLIGASSTHSQGQCRAAFVHYVQGNTVIFYDSSSASQTITSHWWSFGDGTTSTTTKGYETHKYANPGTYWVCHGIQAGNCTDTICDSIVVKGNTQPKCQASFSYTISGNKVQFKNTSTTAQGNLPKKSFWKFGNGSTSDQANPWHQYSNYGTYNVCLTVYDSATQCKDSICQSITLTKPTCNATFKYSDSGNTVQFHGPVSPNSGNPYVLYRWLYGDGDTGFVQNPTHTYKTKKPYKVCLYVVDNGCTAYHCDSIWPAGSGGGQTKCQAYFKYKNVWNNTAEFMNFSTGGGTYVKYTWDFGNGKTSTQLNPKNDFGKPGTYYVCLTMSDSVSNCTSKWCDSVVIASSCKADFVYQSNGKTFYFANTSSANQTLAYYWSFGDGNNSTTKSPTHTYAANGTYQVCLKVAGTNGCSDSVCKTIYIGQKYVIEGNVYYGKTQNTVGKAKVWIIRYDSAKGTLNGVDSGETKTNGSFRFEVAPGYYLVKAALTKIDSLYKRYLPTYHLSFLNWDSATLVTVNSNKYVKIALRPGKNKGGKGFIAGKTSQGANKTAAVGDPVEGIQINLLDENMDAVDHTFSDAAGEWSFADLEDGTYHVIAEEVGKKSTGLPIQLNVANNTVNNIVIEIHSLSTSASFNLGGVDQLNQTGWNIFPNPAQHQLQISGPQGQIMIYTLDGRLMQTQRFQQQPIDISTLQSGMYIVRLVATDGQVLQKKFMKE